MDKRLAKRHKRQVDRAKANVKISEPDVRTPEEIAAAREASRPAAAARGGLQGNFAGGAHSSKGHGVSAAHSASKSDA
ncbi:MAG TPA: hypothetical protein VGL53_06985 [Bryobacteraceae bacterium]|jgi:hypothetical protein